MIFNKNRSLEKLNTGIADKLCTLLSFLRQTTSEFETVAKEVKDKGLKLALLGIAVETNQYANELNAQIKSLEVNYMAPSVQFNSHDVSDYVQSFTSVDGMEDVSEICNKSESFFLIAYRDILKEAIPYPFLKKMIAYQLTGIQGAFMKMRLFGLVRPTYTIA